MKTTATISVGVVIMSMRSVCRASRERVEAAHRDDQALEVGEQEAVELRLARERWWPGRTAQEASGRDVTDAAAGLVEEGVERGIRSGGGLRGESRDANPVA
jgi:hypothetical protein